MAGRPPQATPRIQGDRTGLQLSGQAGATPSLVLLNSGPQEVDATFKARFRFRLPPQIVVVHRARLSLALVPYRVAAAAGISETTFPSGCHVFIDGTDRTTALGGPFGAGAALDVSDLDATAYLTALGWHEVQVSSTQQGGVFIQLGLSLTIAST